MFNPLVSFKSLEGHEGEVKCLTFSQDGKFLASGDNELTVIVWDWQKNQKFSLQGHEKAGWWDKGINSVAFSPCQGFLVSGGDDQTLRIWSLETKELISTLTGHQDKVTAVAVHPDGEIIASGSEDKTVKIWSVKTGEILATLQGHSDKVLTVKFSQNGQLLASGGGENDKTVIIWNLGEKSSITLKGGQFKSELHHCLIYLYRIPHSGYDSQDIFEDDC